MTGSEEDCSVDFGVRSDEADLDFDDLVLLCLSLEVLEDSWK